MTDLHRIQTHARSILEGEGQDEHDPALVEAVARAMWERHRGSETWESLGSFWHRTYVEKAEAALSTIRKHRKGDEV